MTAGGSGDPQHRRAASSRAGLLGGKERTRADENLEEPQGTRERGHEVGLHGAALLGTPWALGTGGDRSVTGGCGRTSLSRLGGCVCGGRHRRRPVRAEEEAGGRPHG